ncbi:MAG: leucine-rich repeat domain-containing protein, partial [Bacteroidales bacterium]|nr:leucine-rich repeat domain-containing protein [Bacteroidales bacterium]
DEVRHLKYLQTLDFYSNINNDRMSIELGTAICDLQYLKYLQVGAYGLISIPDELVKLGSHLVTLDLNSNCLTEIPDILTPENFPALRALNLSTNRRISYLIDLRRASEYEYRGGIGLHLNTNKDASALKRLLLWENLEELGLSFNFIEGSIPDFKVGEEGVRAWSDEDVRNWGGDTIKFLAVNKIPRILPNAYRIKLNLNFFTGDLPDWLLYHPRLLDMDPQGLIFNQQENGRNSKGELVHFDNEPANFDYYFAAFPKMISKYSYDDIYED